MSFIKTLRESVSQIFVCNEGERKGERRKLRRKTETLYYVFSERQTGEKERACVKRTKDRKRERGAIMEYTQRKKDHATK